MKREIEEDYRIGFFLATLNGGGAEKVTLHLAEGLSAQGISVDLIVANAEGPLKHQLPESIRLFDLKSKRVSRSIFRLISYLNRSNISMLFCVLPHTSIVALVARVFSRKNIQIIASEHNTLSQSIANSKTLRGRMLHLPMRFAYRFADNILAVSEGVASDLRYVLSLPKAAVSVIPNPVIGPNFDTLKRRTVMHPWLRNKADPVIVAAGRLTKAKDFPTLIKALARVRKSIPARLIILGEGEDRGCLEQLIQDLDLAEVVDLLGYLPNPYPLFSRADLFVLSSLWEGLPTVLIEALACSTPIISTDCDSGPREILRNGLYGTLVPVGDVVAISRQIENALIDPPEAPPRHAWAGFSYDAVIQRYIRLIEEEMAQ